jgi:hypothetical protein
MTVIPDAYTKFLVSTQTQSNQGRLLKFYSTLSGPSQRWFLVNVTSLLGNVKHIFSVISTKKMRARVKQRTEKKYKDSGHNRNSNRVQRITQIFAQAAHKDCSTIFQLALGRR